jgi:lysophospholipase L1-like esterase
MKMAGKTIRDATILFQGDSITDGGRSRNEDKNHVMGHGYAYLVAARLGADYPEDNLRFLNRGWSGNRVVDMYARWKEDALNLKPDLVSILIGVNDSGSEFSRGAGVPVGKYEKVYRQLLDETREALADVRLVLCEPFYVPHPAIAAFATAMRNEMDERRQVVRRLANECNAVFVPLQERFDEACAAQGVDYWLWDGVHPMPAGHELIARAWVNEVVGC